MAWHQGLDKRALLALKSGDLPGARKGGMTDHIVGPHLIPNVGREAMVPAECVRRQRPMLKKAPEPPKKQPSRSRSAGRKRRRKKRRSPRTDRRRDEEDSSEDERPERKKPTEVPTSHTTSYKRVEENPREKQVQESKARETETRWRAEVKRREEEDNKLKALSQARKKNLIGAFALSQDDMDEEGDDLGKLARERQKAEQMARERRHQERQNVERETERHTGYRSSSGRGDDDIMPSSEARAATDLDGIHHEHKFSSIWKDWDSSKGKDPGEVARQWMRVAACKRPRR